MIRRIIKPILKSRKYSIFGVAEPVKFEKEPLENQDENELYHFIYKDNLEPEIVHGPSVMCNGGPNGHEKVFIKVEEDIWHECPYCYRRYIRAKKH